MYEKNYLRNRTEQIEFNLTFRFQNVVIPDTSTFYSTTNFENIVITNI